jgi:hypothetical protein
MFLLQSFSLIEVVGNLLELSLRESLFLQTLQSDRKLYIKSPNSLLRFSWSNAHIYGEVTLKGTVISLPPSASYPAVSGSTFVISGETLARAAPSWLTAQPLL